MPLYLVKPESSNEKTGLIRNNQPKNEYNIFAEINDLPDSTKSPKNQPKMFDTMESSQGGIAMDNNDWAQQYIGSVDRQLAEIRKENAENRREIKADIHEYINAVSKKIDDSMEQAQYIREQIKEEFGNIKEDNKESKREIADTAKHVRNITMSVIVALIANFIAISALVYLAIKG